MRELAKRICTSPVLKTRLKLSRLLLYLVEHDGEPGQLTAAAIMASLGLESPETVRIHVARLRAALRFYFLYCRDGLDQAEQLDVPEATADENQHDHHRSYKVIIAKRLHLARGAEAFWQSHFLARQEERGNSVLGTTIVFTEPLMFRDTKNRFYIRHLDINDREEVPRGADPIDPVAELLETLPWIRDRRHIVVSRGYVPGGEVLAKDNVRAWLIKHAEWVKNSGGHVIMPSPFAREDVSRKIPNVHALDNYHCVLLGSSRANWVIRYFQNAAKDILPITIESDGIAARCTDREYRQMKTRLMELKGSDIKQEDLQKMIRRVKGVAILKEDWTKLSFALVSRALDHSKKCVITVLGANQGRGIQALGGHILTADEPMNQVLDQFRIIGPLPKAFQMLFAIVLEDQESGFSTTRWKPLLYREISTRVKGPRSSSSRNRR